MNKKLLVLRGLPASGKSTYAKKILADSKVGSVVRINNDELSLMMFGSSYAKYQYSATLLHRIRANIIREAFRNHAELVILDNTNLNKNGLDVLRKLADACGAEFEIDDEFLDVPIEVCIERDAQRANPVGADVIGKMYLQLLKERPIE